MLEKGAKALNWNVKKFQDGLNIKTRLLQMESMTATFLKEYISLGGNIYLIQKF